MIPLSYFVIGTSIFGISSGISLLRNAHRLSKRLHLDKEQTWKLYDYGLCSIFLGIIVLPLFYPLMVAP